MNRIFSILIAVVTLFGMVSCMYIKFPQTEKTNIETIKEFRTVPIQQMSDFNAISVKQGIQVKYIQTGQPNIKVITNIKDPKLLNIRVENHELIVEYQPSVTRITESIHTHVEITGYDIRDIEVSSGGKVSVEDKFIVNGELEFDGTSGGSISLSHCQADKVKVDVSSGGDFNLASGMVRELEVDASSGASIRIVEIVADHLSADASSGARIGLGGKAGRVSYEASSAAYISADGLAAEAGEAKASSGASLTANVKKLIEQSGSGGSVRNVAR